MRHTGINKLRLFFINLVILLTSISNARSQNNRNNIELTAINTGFNLTTASNLEAQQIKTNAFRIVASSRNSNTFSILAKVSSSTSSTGTPLPASMLAVRLNTISPSITANFNTITLSTTDQLIQQVTTNANSVTFNYDLLAGPVGFNYAPGNYNVSMLFTMTQP